jgi:hypothetical protein
MTHRHITSNCTTLNFNHIICGTVYFRFCAGTSEMEMIQLYSLDDYAHLPVNKWNIKQPPDNDNERISIFDTGQEL